MPRALFEGFLEDDAVYRACQAYWDDLVDACARATGQLGGWERWIHSYADGTPFGEGNPIYAGRSASVNRAYRIIQYPADPRVVEIDGWLKSYPEGFDLPAHEMVLNLGLTEEASNVAQSLLAAWMSPQTTRVAMERLLANLRGEEGADPGIALEPPK